MVSPSLPESKSGIEEVDDKGVMAEEDMGVHSDAKRGRSALRSKSKSKAVNEGEVITASQHVEVAINGIHCSG